MSESIFSKITKQKMAQAANPAHLGGMWHGKPYPHICKELRFNFIDGEVPIYYDLKQAGGTKIHYHQGAAHLNSSQVMCISFFKKFFDTPERESMLLKILRETITSHRGIDPIPVNVSIIAAYFEFEPDHRERTNFDFYLELSSGSHISIEVKFTEPDFGKTSPCRNDPQKYAQKWRELYIPLLKECPAASEKSLACKNSGNPFECVFNGELNNKCPHCTNCFIYEFYAHYQIWRNISYASAPSDMVLFLTPRENKALEFECNYIDGLSNQFDSPAISNIYWEDLIKTSLINTINDNTLNSYLSLFAEKYTLCS